LLLELNELSTKGNQVNITLQLLNIVVLHQSQAIHSSLTLARNRLQTPNESLPKVLEQGTVHFLQRFLRRGINRHIQLSHWLQFCNLLGKLGGVDKHNRLIPFFFFASLAFEAKKERRRKVWSTNLSIGHQERRDLMFVKQIHKLIDVRIHDRLTNKGQSTVANLKGLLIPLLQHSRHTLHLLHHAIVILHRSIHNRLSIIKLPSPARSNWVCVMSGVGQQKEEKKKRKKREGTSKIKTNKKEERRKKKEERRISQTSNKIHICSHRQDSESFPYNDGSQSHKNCACSILLDHAIKN